MLSFLASHYALLKIIHLGCILISVSFFSLRVLWAFLGSDLLKAKWVKITPHCVDSVLLLSAIGLALVWTQMQSLPLWIVAKTIGLVFYIGFGIFTFRIAKNALQRSAYFILALLSLCYITGVAFSKNALFFIA